MHFFYNLTIYIISKIIPFIGIFIPKIKLFSEGRKQTIPILKEKLLKSDKIIWIHTASLGEYEQGLPIIKELKKTHPNHKIVVSFFSPSGYEIKKNSSDADVFVYLPLDIPSKVTEFLNILSPEMVIFIKYEFWANFLFEIKKRNIPLFLVSGIFRKKQIFFRWYGGFMRSVLHNFTHFFVQDENSYNLLKSINLKNCTISGDTRFDRVCEILERDNSLSFIEEFKNNTTCIVLGSTWEDDEFLFLNFINSASKNIKFIIAPHNIHSEKIKNLQKKIKQKSVLFSEKENKNLKEYQIFIIDTIGILTKIYSYADIAYVGGGMKTGLHNILEPATFGIPVLIGKNYTKFREAVELVQAKGVFSVATPTDFEKKVTFFISDTNFRKKTGNINATYIQHKKGATKRFMNFIFPIS